MAKINCFHCNAEIELVNTKKGKNKCPNCNKTFKIHNSRKEFENIVMAQTDNNVNTFENTVDIPKAKKINKFESVVIAPNDNNLNNVITLPQSTILAKNIKVMILSPLGIIVICYGLIMLFNGAGFFTEFFGRQEGGGLLNLLCSLSYVLCGIYLLLPAIYYNSDLENKKLEHHLRLTNQILPNQSITNPTKSNINFLLQILIILLSIVFVLVLIFSGGWLLILLLFASGGGGAFG